MRTFEEINADIESAKGRNDVHALRSLATEIREHGTPAAQAEALIATGVVGMLTGDYPSALDRCRRALAVYEELGDSAGAARAIANMGIVYVNTGDYSSALEHYRRALTIHEELGDRAGAARVTGNIGNVYLNTDDYPSALEHFRRALVMQEELGDRAAVARATGNMGIVYVDTGDYPSALEHFHRSLAVLEELGDHASVARVVGNIGNVCSHASDYSSALEHFRRALVMHEELRNSAGAALIAGNMIKPLMELERYNEAAALLERQAAMQMDNPGVRAVHFANWAAIAEHGGDLDTANDHLKKALSITAEAGLRAGSVAYHQRLRDLAQKRNDFAGYIEHNNEYLRISEEIRGKEATQKLAMMEAERKIEAERRERDKERALLYGALPKSVADRMIRGEDVTGDHFDNAAVMFLDIVGFTTHTSHMPPAEVVKMLENIFRTIDGICAAHNIVKIKTIGDSYMCFKGDEDAATDAQSIANAALDVMKHRFSWPNAEPLALRVGIHIGPATAGVLGTERLQYDVWGDTVNVASRMESTGEAGHIHVSEAFADALRSAPYHNFILTERGTVDVKGKGAMMTFWLEGA